MAKSRACLIRIPNPLAFPQMSLMLSSLVDITNLRRQFIPHVDFVDQFCRSIPLTDLSISLFPLSALYHQPRFLNPANLSLALLPTALSLTPADLSLSLSHSCRLLSHSHRLLSLTPANLSFSLLLADPSFPLLHSKLSIQNINPFC